MIKKIISVLLSVCMLMCFTLTVFANDNADGEKATDYPFVFVHGIFGWGENDTALADSSYWGFSEGVDVLTYMRSQGYVCCSPSLGKVSSAWDRACEMYAQLTGSVVDYGASHSAEHGHERFGRDYTGKAILNGGWNTQDKINLITHSFGGPTATLFTALLANGDADEIAASPDDCSELFKGGHTDCIYSVTEFCSPHNGTPGADFLYGTFLPLLFVSAIINAVGMTKAPAFDFILDQWGLTADPATGETAGFDIKSCIRFASTKDNCAADMTVDGAKQLNAVYGEVPSVYYFSYACNFTQTSKLGLTLPVDFADSMAMQSMASASLSWLANDGIHDSSDWAANDGLVPLISALYPFTAEETHVDYTENTVVVPGVWHVMPVIEGGSHSTFVNGSPQELYARYAAVLEVLDGI